MIIGLIGLNVVGKGIVVDYLKGCGFVYYLFFDVICDVFVECGKELICEYMIVIGNELWAVGGVGVLVYGIF